MAERFENGYKGHVAVVTGGGTGMGRELVRQLTAQGCDVATCDVIVDNLAETVDICVKDGNPGAILTHMADVSDETQVLSFRDAVATWRPHVNVVFNNAGIGGGSRIVDTEPGEWDAVQETNVAAVFHLSRAFAKQLIARKAPGAIINIASVVAEKVGVSSASYAASKAAVLHLTKAQAFEWAKHQIRVNAICPGYIHSEMTDDYLASAAGLDMIRRVPQRRAGDPSDLDGALLLFASARASGFITGASLLADGGLALA